MIGTIFGLLIPLMGTVLGSAFVFFMRNEMPARLQKALLGFASYWNSFLVAHRLYNSTPSYRK